MAVELDEFIPSLKREVTPLGSRVFDSIANSTWVGYLSDAFWEAKLDGFLTDYQEDDGTVRPLREGGADISRAAISLIILYAGIRVLRNQILNTKTSFTAKSGATEFSQQQSATTLAEMLRQLAARKKALIDAAEAYGEKVAMFDLMSSRLHTPVGYWGGPELAG